MSRWICIDDICIPSDENDWEELVAFADAIAEQEPIDIVRCGECKRANYEWSGVRCGLSDALMGEDGFCSIGERRESRDR